MPTNLKYSLAARNGQLSDLNTRIGTNALIRLYDGTQPAGPDTAITTQVLLAIWTGNAAQFGAVAAGVLTASAVTNTTALANGTASWLRILTSGGVAVVDGSAGTSASDLILNSVAVTSGVTCSFTSLAITENNI